MAKQRTQAETIAMVIDRAFEHQPECGCRVRTDHDGLVRVGQCPLHAAASDLATALRDIVEALDAGCSAEAIRDTEGGCLDTAKAALRRLR